MLLRVQKLLDVLHEALENDRKQTSNREAKCLNGNGNERDREPTGENIWNHVRNKSYSDWN